MNLLFDVIQDLADELWELNNNERRICIGLEVGRRLVELSTTDPDFVIFDGVRNDFVGLMATQFLRATEAPGEPRPLRGEALRQRLMMRGLTMSYAMRVRLARRVKRLCRRRRGRGPTPPKWVSVPRRITLDSI